MISKSQNRIAGCHKEKGRTKLITIVKNFEKAKRFLKLAYASDSITNY
jgi:hypothetical protein